MRKIWTLALAANVAFAPLPAPGQLLLTGAGGAKIGAAYQGPGDIVSGALAFWSCRAYSLAKAGTKAYRIVRASDSAQTDINSLANGLCDVPTPTAFCASTTCKVVTYYDQTGALACAGSTACDLTQATSANQPALTISALSGSPCATDSGVTGIALSTAAVLAQAQPFTLTGIGERTGNLTGAQRLINSNGSATNFGWRSTANTVGMQSGTITATASDSAYHAFVVTYSNGGTSSIVVDGAATTGTLGAISLGGLFVVMNDATGSGDPMTGSFCEAGAWPSLFNSTQYGNMNGNMHGVNGWNF